VDGENERPFRSCLPRVQRTLVQHPVGHASARPNHGPPQRLGIMARYP
jgi:hypothetical protein